MADKKSKGDKKSKFDDWMVRISFAEAGESDLGFDATGVELKTRLALDKVMVMKSERMEDSEEKVEAGEDKAAGRPSEDRVGQKLRLMILDDEPIVGKRLAPTLTKSGFEVEVFLNPKQALERMDEAEFDIVVTDFRMDEIDGIEVLEQILSKCQNTRVILITGYATVEVAREALMKGAFDFIAKPFKPRDLKAVINKAALSLGHTGKLD
jgi:CheY-like chemotaxis protein